MGCGGVQACHLTDRRQARWATQILVIATSCSTICRQSTETGQLAAAAAIDVMLLHCQLTADTLISGVCSSGIKIMTQ